MSYSVDANLLLYASNSAAVEHNAALAFLQERSQDPDVFCLTWPTLMAYLRIATHPAIFKNPLSREKAWLNVENLLSLPRVVVIMETDDFAETYVEVTRGRNIRGNLVPDAHLATLLQLHGVFRIYTADSDFRKFDFLEVVNPLR